MSRAVSIEKIVDSCIKGIENSFYLYEEWSGGNWLSLAPEYLLTVNIAKEINNVDGSSYLTLEDNVLETLKSANANLIGRPSSYMRKDGRIDIVVWWTRYTPRAAIEVKHRIYVFDDIAIDIDRIIEILKKESDMQFGISTFYMGKTYAGNSEEKMIKRIETLYKQTKEYIKEYGNNLRISRKYSVHAEDDENVWAAVAFIIKK